MNYLVEWLENKQTQDGREYRKVSLKDETGVITTDVSVWPDFAGYKDVTLSNMVTGIIREKGKYKNLVSELDKPKFMKQGIAAAQEKKAEYIREAQARKSDSIAYFNSLNAAINLVKTYDLADNEKLKEKIIYWRDFFLNEYEHYEKQDHVTPF